MTTQGSAKQTSQKADRLTLEQAKQIFSSSTMSEHSDFSLIKTYYHPNVRFRDAIQELTGRDELIEMTRRFTARCSLLEVSVKDAAQNGDVIFLQWTMRMRFGKSPLTTIEGTTKLSLDAHGKVIEHRDYFDLWGDTLDAIPAVGKLYRRILQKLG